MYLIGLCSSNLPHNGNLVIDSDFRTKLLELDWSRLMELDGPVK